jgi:hypothetical protein
MKEEYIHTEGKTSENTLRTPYYSTESIYCRNNNHEGTMKSIYVHMCDLQVVMKADQSSDFSVGSSYITPPSRRCDHTSRVEGKSSETNSADTMRGTWVVLVEFSD